MDESKMGEWLEGYKSMEVLEGEPLTVGSKHKMIFEEDGTGAYVHRDRHGYRAAH